jgi:O-antigen/teichoic acid export membrane protein
VPTIDDSTPPAVPAVAAAPAHIDAPVDVLDSGEAGGRAIRGGAMRAVGYGGVLALSLVAVPVMVRHLGVVDFGRYVSVTALVFVIGTFTEGGLTNLGIREYSVRTGAERERFQRNLAGIRLTLGSLAVLVAVAFTAATRPDPVLIGGAALAAVGLLLSTAQQTYAVPLYAQLRLGWITALELFKQAVLTALVVALVLAGAGLLAFFAAAVGSGGAVLLATFALVREDVSLRPRFDRDVWATLLRDVLPYALALAVGAIYFRIAIVLLPFIASDADTGIYSAAFRIVEVITAIPLLVVSTGFPILSRAARDDAARLRYALQRLFEVAVLLGAGMAVAIGIGAPVAIAVVAGSGFDDSIAVLRVLGVALLTSFLAATWSFALLSLREHRRLLQSNALAVVVTTAGVLLLEPLMGVIGAAVATVAGEAVLGLAYLASLTLPRRELLPHPAILVKAAVAAAVALTALLLPAPAAVQTILGLALYVAAAWLLRAVPPELLTALTAWRRGAE